ncbi:MAG: MBL fold metallo-hydrolase [Candidatus Binatus sp.]|uniref:MBL fold metallo-hydrolase n=1 Tax=Candidatus Binatus sp. TaxID=2811406 RepID=UPI003C731CE4
MSRSARRLTACAAVLVLLAGLGWWMAHVPAVQDALLRRIVERTLGATRNDLLADDALRVVLCGTGNPLPDPNRANACTAVFAGGNMYLVDAGPGAGKNLALWHLPVAKLAAVMLTHYHSDHIGELGEINMQTWAQGRANPLRVYGPPGVEVVVGGFAQAYALDRDYRQAHHGAALMPPANWTMEPHVVKIDTAPGAGPCAGGSATVLEENGLKVTAFTVNHAPVAPAYGYRFDYKGRSVVISGDTTKCANLVAQARGVDVLIHEAQSASMVKIIEAAAIGRGNARIAKIMSDILRYHTTPEDAAAEANEAGVRLLVLSHIGPPTPNAFVRMAFMRGVGAVRPRGVVLGYDGMLLTLPAGSDTIDTSSVN